MHDMLFTQESYPVHPDRADGHMEVSITYLLVLHDATLTGTVLNWSQQISTGNDIILYYIALDIII